MKIKTSELTGAALDWAVAKCEGYTDLHKIEGRPPHEPQLAMMPPRKAYGAVEMWELGFSTDWAQGGPIIEREGIRLHRGVGGYWWAATDEEPQRPLSAPTPLVAAMRCYVTSKLGNEVQIPDDLV